MGDAVEVVGGLFLLLLLVAAACIGGLLITSNAILIKEQQGKLFSGYVCTYFTGTRQVEIVNYSATGCPRFVKVGE
jgi:hypothetical protein